MGMKNTSENFGVVAKWLHWVTAICFLICFLVVWYRRYVAEFWSASWHASLDYHMMAGWTVLILVIPRLIWRAKNPHPVDPPGSKLEHLGAKFGHWALYAMMIIMPITGYMGTHDPTNMYFLFEIPKLQDTWIWSGIFEGIFGMTWDQMETTMDIVHKKVLGAWFLWILIVVHVAAGFYHHFGKRDTTMVRMLPWTSAPEKD